MKTCKELLPKIYLPVITKYKRKPFQIFGILNTKQNSLIIFTDLGSLEYRESKLKEFEYFLNPENGMEYEFSRIGWSNRNSDNRTSYNNEYNQD